LRNHSAPAGKNGYWPAAGALDNAGIAARGGKTIDFLHPVTASDPARKMPQNN
jgi:hypothetical protein